MSWYIRQNRVQKHTHWNGQENHEPINSFEAWRQLTLHYAGGHRAQQFSLLRTLMSPAGLTVIIVGPGF
eukprot:5153922-Amphidinium_carterae.2